jgi:prophage maintenance system killer protein
MKALVWIDELDALTLHDRLLALHGGAPGVRDDGVLFLELNGFAFTASEEEAANAVLALAGCDI